MGGGLSAPGIAGGCLWRAIGSGGDAADTQAPVRVADVLDRAAFDGPGGDPEAVRPDGLGVADQVEQFGLGGLAPLPRGAFGLRGGGVLLAELPHPGTLAEVEEAALGGMAIERGQGGQVGVVIGT